MEQIMTRTAHKRFFTINKLPLLLMILGFIMVYVLAPGFMGEKKTIPTSEFPVYGSENQDSADGWVMMDVVSAVYLGRAEWQLTTNRGTSASGVSFCDNLFLVKDSEGHIAVFTDKDYKTYYNITDRDRFQRASEINPKRIYGKIGSFEDSFKSYNGYDKLEVFAEYDLITEYQYPAQTAHYVQTEHGIIMYGICFTLGAGCLIAAFVSWITQKRRARRARELWLAR